MGWRLHRIWSVDWFRNPDQEIARAIRAVERAIAAGEPSIGVEAPSIGRSGSVEGSTAPTGNGATVVPPAPTHPRFASYSRTRPAQRPNRDLLLDSKYRRRLEEEIIRVVREEQPIHRDLILERLKELHGVGRAGSNVQGNFETALSQAIRSREVTVAPNRFVSLPGTIVVDRFRCPAPGDPPRAIEHISPDELRLAVLHVVEQQYGLPRDALVREVAVTFGFRRTSADIADAIGEVVDDLIERGELRKSGPQIQLP